MAALRFRVQLDRSRTHRRYLALAATNVALTVTTAAFMLLWGRIDQFSPGIRSLIRYVLVHGHLAAENVVAAWYSSMLMLCTAAGAVLAYEVDRRQCQGRRGFSFGWLGLAAVFALLSLDEIGSIHERVGMLTGSGLPAKPVGWMYLLAVPILVVGLLILAFAWIHVNRVPAAFRLLAAGVGMFLLNPLFEMAEMSLIHGAGAAAGTWQRRFHDLLLVLEEGGLELFGILFFLAAVLTYAARTGGETIRWTVDARATRWWIVTVTVGLLIGTWGARWIVARLPEGDTGIPQNWFPAAALLLAGLLAGTLDEDRKLGRLGMVMATLSAFFGAGLHGYTSWQSYEALRLVFTWSLAALFGIALRACCRFGWREAAATLFMAAAATIPGEYAPLLAIAGAGLAAEALLTSRRAAAEAAAPVSPITA